MKSAVFLLIVFHVSRLLYAESEEGLKEQLDAEDAYIEDNAEAIEEIPELNPEELLLPEAYEREDYLSLSGKFISDSSIGIKRETPYSFLEDTLGLRELDNSETLRLRLIIAPSGYVKAVADGGFKFFPYAINPQIQFDNISPFLSEAYTQVSLGDVLFFRAGLQQLDWSTAYIWSPTGRLNRLNSPLSPARENAGVLGLTSELLTRYISFTFGLIFPDFRIIDPGTEKINILDSTLANRLLFSYNNTSITLNWAVFFDGEAAWENMVSDFFVGSGINQEAAGFILYLDCGASYSENLHFHENGTFDSSMDWNFGASFGLNRKVFNDGFIIFEYNYNSAGFSWQDIKNFSRALSLETPSIQDIAVSAFRPGEISQHHFYLHYHHTIMDLVEIGRAHV